MDVILLERVEKLGQIGDVVTVKNGFARNFLLPNKKALRANAANKKLFEANRAKIEADNADRRVEAEAASKDVDGKTVQLIRQASNTGQLYGSVSARDIVEALEAEGAKVTKSQVVLDRPIKAIGMHEVQDRAPRRGRRSRSRSTSPARLKRPSCRRRASTSWRRCSNATKPASPRITIPTPSPGAIAEGDGADEGAEPSRRRSDQRERRSLSFFDPERKQPSGSAPAAFFVGPHPFVASPFGFVASPALDRGTRRLAPRF